ncbi:sigma 54-interacting transcriptional regulator [Nitrospina watsonii]|uniref:GAF sensor protein n=1 Tax=Nitrospina watsonii TaxID=1323948 RepID=A0ABM9HE43_9BACT|nr:sigma 54-interacting transcriptional regulator [Nitrospina watsonii]CAI2718430.1 Putative GAF sensor protein [Nitrospina watsonii]
MTQDLNALTANLKRFQKENLSDILHVMAGGLKNAFRCDSVRIYLEDLYEGMLICHYVSDENHPDRHRITKYISPKESITSKAFYENAVVASWKHPGGVANFRNPFETLSGIQSTAVFPITYQMRPIGTINLDWNKDGEFLTPAQIEQISAFIADNSAGIERAKRFHQNISFSKYLDTARKKEGAWMMMRSAVNLIEKLSLASVLVPATEQNSKTRGAKTADLVEILAVYSKNIEHADIYNKRDQIHVLEGRHLINRIVRYEKKQGLVMNDPNQNSIYHENVMDEQFPRKEIASEINLVSLYQVPKYDKKTGRFICAINYYTGEPYEFTPFEKTLLQEHASMVETIILEESPTHIEIQVLSEIEELLSDTNTSLPRFLDSILAKTSELIGADCGTIALLQTIDGKPWLQVEDEDGGLIGAKSRGWKKNKIMPLQVGGNDLPDDVKSMNGYCAHTARPVLLNDVRNSRNTQGFYKNLSPAIRSELAVPIIYQNRVLGVLNQDSFRLNFFTDEHKKILQIIASLISQKVNHLLQIEALRRDMTVLKREIEYRDPNVSSYYLGNVIGRSRKIHTLVKQIDVVVDSICNRMLNWERSPQTEAFMGLPSLLITGETGAGKEFFFNNIYSRVTETFRQKKRPDFELPLRKTNIAAYSGELTYSELFGHKKGAFTSADSNRQGILEEANGGIVFLDEIGDIDPKTQVQLLRFLDTGVFVRLGENQPCYARIFLIAATNKNLLKEIEAGRFREDLYHRLNALSFRIPSLNDRREDIPDLATHFLGRLYTTYKGGDQTGPAPRLGADAMEYLKHRSYRGNVRELKNILLRALMFNKGGVITRDHLAASDQENMVETAAFDAAPVGQVTNLLEEIESARGNFWTHIYEPFKTKQMTRDTVKTVIETAKTKYQTNLPGLAVKLGVCTDHFRTDSEESKKFMSFKNFLYKTVKISEN